MCKDPKLMDVEVRLGRSSMLAGSTTTGVHHIVLGAARLHDALTG